MTDGSALPLVSIVTPTLNQARYLGQTLASVDQQTYPNVEHIVVDGVSADETLDVLRRAERPGRRWISEPDSGMYEAVNKGLRMAGGEILTYLNSDDLLLPWSVDVVVQALLEHRAWDLAYGDAFRYYEELDAFELVLQAPFHRSLLTRTGSFVQPAVFWRRHVMESNGAFDQSLRYSADLDYWLKATREHSAGHVSEVLAVERAHAGSQTSRMTTQLRAEGTVVRGRHQHDALFRRPKKWVARIALELLVRVQMIRFAVAWAMRAKDWSRLRREAHPRLVRKWFLVGLVTPRPLSGTPVRTWRMRLLRGRWLSIEPTSVLPSGEGRIDSH